MVFAGIFIRQQINGPAAKDSSELYHFLESAMKQTTDCALRYEPDYQQLGDLFDSCHRDSGARCTNGKQACQVLEEEMNNLLEVSWPVSEDRYKGYRFNSTFSEEERESELISISAGNCTGRQTSASYLISSFDGKITNRFYLCY